MTWRITRPYTDQQMARTAEWVCAMMNGAVETAAKLGRSCQAIVAQAALESGWGRYGIGFNVFGIKASPAWTGPVLMRRTAEQHPDGSVYYVDAAFRDYPSYAASIADHFAFLRDNSRYAAAGVFDAKTDEEYFEALKRAGYATDVDYVSKLMAMVKSVETFLAGMTQDGEVPAPTPAPEPRLLLIGMKGDDVRALQMALFKVDGDFGPATLAAVMAFQRENGLVVDGMVGEATRKALHL